MQYSSRRVSENDPALADFRLAAPLIARRERTRLLLVRREHLASGSRPPPPCASPAGTPS